MALILIRRERISGSSVGANIGIALGVQWSGYQSLGVESHGVHKPHGVLNGVRMAVEYSLEILQKLCVNLVESLSHYKYPCF